MVAYLPLLLMVPAGAMIAEDFKGREVRLAWLVLFAAGSLLLGCVRYGLVPALGNLLFNSLLLAGLFGVTAIWLRVRKGKAGFATYIGLGDVILLLSLAPLFDLRGYVIFLIVSMSASLVWWGAVRLILRKDTTIPLVGTAGAVFCAYLIISVI